MWSRAQQDPWQLWLTASRGLSLSARMRASPAISVVARPAAREHAFPFFHMRVLWLELAKWRPDALGTGCTAVMR